MLADQSLQLADELRMAPQGEIALDPPFQTDNAQLLEPSDLRLGEALVGELGERGVPPERQRLLQLPLFLQALEAREIELIGFDPQQIAGHLRLHALPAEHLSELRDVHLQSLVRRRRRLVVPQRVDQPVAGDDPVRLHQEQSQKRALLLPAEIERSSVRQDLERAQDPKLHADLRPR